MMWVHGGGHLIGGSSVPQYDGAAFARDGVVFVSIIYRLGILGGFAYPALTREARPDEPLGSFGITDEIAALRWIKRNIAAFGGDPGNVTLFGESGGGGDTWQLLTVPSAKGLFQKAVLESPGGWRKDPVTLAQSEAAGVKVASELGLPANATAEQLRAVPWQTLIKMNSEVGFSPIVDGRLIKESRDRAMAAGHVHDVPVMVGWNDYEASLMAVYGDKPADVIKAMPPTVRAVYQAAGDARTETTLARAQHTDSAMGAPARWLAASMASGAPAYLYQFSYVPENARAQAAGAGHAAEEVYVFDTLDRMRHPPLTAADRAVATRVHGCWVSFAKTGRPLCPGGPAWPAYSRESDQLMELGATNQVRRGFRKAQLDAQEAFASPGK